MLMDNYGHRHPIGIVVGDVVDISSGINVHGFISNSSKKIIVDVILGKGIDGAVTGVSVAGGIGFRGVKGYLPSGSWRSYELPSGSGYSSTATIRNRALGIIRIELTVNTAMSNAISDTPVNGEAGLTFTFS